MKTIKRSIYKSVLDEAQYSISLLIGPRRVGKTTLMKQIMKEKGGLFIYCKDIEIKKLTPEEFINFIRSKVKDGIKNFFLDEVQDLESWDQILVIIFDTIFEKGKNIIIATSSSATSLKRRELGVNRIRRIFLNTWSFDEYLKIKQIDRNLENLENYLGSGYPDIWFENWNLAKTREFILNPIIEVDIPKAYPGTSEILLARFIFYLANLSNGEYNQQAACKFLEINRLTANKYINILEKAMFIKTVKRFKSDFTLPKKIMLKVYINPHLHLIILGKKFKLVDPKFIGHIVESFWLFDNELYLKSQGLKIGYLKNKENREIDFALYDEGMIRPKCIIEFKYKDKINFDDYKNFASYPHLRKIIISKKSSEPLGDIENYSILDNPKDYLS